MWWALGALVLAAAAIVAIFFGDDLTGTSAADSGTTEETTTSTAPALPSVTEGTSTPSASDTATTAGTAPTSAAGGDPLGVGVPMTAPACDGTWIVILGSAIEPAAYADDVRTSLSSNPEAKYVLTQAACASLRQQTAEGNQIYAVWIGPYPDQQSACAVRNQIGGGVYVKRMDDTTPPETTWQC